MDIVERLRKRTFKADFPPLTAKTEPDVDCYDAADEIERLREALKDMSFYITGHNWTKLKSETTAVYDTTYKKDSE